MWRSFIIYLRYMSYPTSLMLTHMSIDEMDIIVVGTRNPNTNIHEIYVVLLLLECQSGAHLIAKGSMVIQGNKTLLLKMIKLLCLFRLMQLLFNLPKSWKLWYIPSPTKQGRQRKCRWIQPNNAYYFCCTVKGRYLSLHTTKMNKCS